MALLRITWPILRARSSCGSGGKPRNASILPSANSSIGLADGLVTQSISSVGIEPDIGGHDREKHVRARAERLDAHAFALQIEDGADGLVREQLEAAGMHTRQDRDRHAGIDRDDERRREVQTEVDLAAPRSSRAGSPDRHRHVADIGEAFRAQQLLGHVLRREADAGYLVEADRGRLRRPFVGERCPGAKDAAAAADDALARKSRRE